MASADAADGGLPSAASSRLSYEVFLSSWAADTAWELTELLYRMLITSGFHPYGDYEELRKDGGLGQDVLNAIEQSRVFIPIFSKGYASSKCCLTEVAKMVESMLSSAEPKVILPIYYDVTPDEVRCQTGAYAEAFSKHESSGMLTRETVQEWRDALSEVGNIQGLELAVIRNRAKLIHTVASLTMTGLRMSEFPIPLRLVGIDDHMEAIMGLLNLDEGNDVRAVGIRGVHGIGKTTLAMAVYNQIVHRFEASSIIINVREGSQLPGGLAHLQGRFISAILGLEIECPSVDHGIDVLRNILRHNKILIILDDVDRTEQLDALAQPHWLAPGSRIIVTTQNGNVLPEHHWHSEFGLTYYEVTEMDAHDALRLFCRRAFHAESPPAGYASFSWEFVKATGGHPLSIVIMGISLWGTEIAFWEATLKRMRFEPEGIVQDILRNTYDSLEQADIS